MSQIKDKDHPKDSHLEHKPVLAPWDVHLTTYEIPPEVDFVGQTLLSLSLRERFGINIAMIDRGQKRITAPARTEILMPFDKVTVIGDDSQLEKFENYIKSHKQETSGSSDPFSLERYLVTKESPFLDKEILASGIRDRTDGLVVGIERKKQRILNPHSGFKIELHDLLWIVGNRSKIKSLS